MTRENRLSLGMIGGACLILLALAGCREGEQNRVISFEKGAFPGGAPTGALSDEQLGELRGRAKQIQSFY